MTNTILIVEDQADIRQLIRMTLEFGDFEIHEAADGESGLAAARRLQPDLVLLDVMMPGVLDGYQVCRALRQEADHRQIKIVMLTARGQADDLSMGEQAGADAYLLKPFSPLDLIDRIESMLG